MQTELDATTTTRRIRILGVNRIGQQSGNALIVAGRTLPWMQDTAEVGAWGLWNVVFRDVVIVDRLGQRVTAFNLTENDLSDPNHYGELKAQLIDAANAE